MNRSNLDEDALSNNDEKVAFYIGEKFYLLTEEHTAKIELLKYSLVQLEGYKL